MNATERETGVYSPREVYSRSPYDDAYWLRYFSAAAMQQLMVTNTALGTFVAPAGTVAGQAAEYALLVLAEIKRVESEKK